MHRSVKPQVLSALGDVALAIGANFKNYLQPVLLTLEQAASLKIDTVCAHVVCLKISRNVFYGDDNGDGDDDGGNDCC